MNRKTAIRRFAYLFTTIVAVLISACGEAKQNKQTAKPSGVDDITSNWYGVIASNSRQSFRFDLILQQDGDALIATLDVGNDQLPPNRPGRVTGLFKEPALIGSFDPVTQRFSVETPEGQDRRWQLSGLIAGDNMVVSLAELGLRQRVTMRHPGVAEHRKSTLSNALDVVDALAGQRYQTSAGECPDELRQWVDYARALTKRQRNPSERYQLLDDEHFINAFGKSHGEMSADELLDAAGKLRGQCATERKDIQLVTQLSYLLIDARTYRTYVVDNFRERVGSAWSANVLTALADTPLPDQRTIAMLQSVKRDYRLDGNAISTTFDAAIKNLSVRAAAKQTMTDYLASIDDQRDNFFQLVGLASFGSRFEPDDFDTVRERISQYLPDAAANYAESSRNLQQARYMQSWVTQYADSNAVCPSAKARHCEMAVGQFRRALEKLALQFVKKEQAIIARRTLQIGLPGIAALKDEQSKIERRYAGLNALPAFVDFRESLAKQRRRLQSQSKAELLDAVESAANAATLIKLQTTYFGQGDLSQKALRDVDEVLGERLADIAPFRGLPGEDYLNALYASDARTLEQLDVYYTAGIKPLMDLMSTSFGYIGPLIDAANGQRNGTTRATFDQGVRNLSAIHSVFGTYLLDYGDVYDGCLDSNAPEFETVQSSELVTTRYGVEVSRTRQWTKRDRYRVPARMAPYFSSVWRSGADNGVADIMDYLINDNRGTTLVRGIRDAMKRFDCDAPEIVKLEQGMQNYFDDVAQRMGL